MTDVVSREARFEPKSDRPPEPVDRRLARALSHPLRVQILAVLNQQTLSPAQFARRYRVSVGTVSYHFRELSRLGFLELVEERQGRGSPQHFYRAAKPGIVSGTDWSKLGEVVQAVVSTAELQDFISRVVRAITSGTLDAKEDNHFTWTALSLDQRGWRDLIRANRQLLKTVAQIERDAAERLVDSGELPVPATFALAGFESQDGQ